MSDRIVDEKFARELESRGADLERGKDSNTPGDDEVLIPAPRGSGLRGLLKRFVWRIVRPMLVPVVQQERNRYREALAENVSRVAENVHRVYIKTGETLAALRADLLAHISSRSGTSAEDVGKELHERVEAALARSRETLLQYAEQARGDVRLSAEAMLRYLEERVEAVERDARRGAERSSRRLTDALERIELLQHDLHAAQGRIGALAAMGQYGGEAFEAESGSVGDEFYRLHQDAFRGSSDEVLRRQRIYIECFRESGGPVLDLGCGRGEFIELLGAEGIEAEGVDANKEMVAYCTERGLHVANAELLEALRRRDDDSLGGLFCAQVVEHLAPGAVLEITREAHRALRPGGVAVVETINPYSLFALSRFYYLDPTHRSPLPPPLLRLYFESAGFSDVSIVSSSEQSAADRLPSIELDAPAPREVERAMDALNENLGRLNDLLFGAYDYAVIARK